MSESQQQHSNYWDLSILTLGQKVPFMFFPASSEIRENYQCAHSWPGIIQGERAVAGVSRNVVKIDERSIFCPKDRQFFAPQAKRRQWIGYSWHLRDMSIFQQQLLEMQLATGVESVEYLNFLLKKQKWTF